MNRIIQELINIENSLEQLKIENESLKAAYGIPTSKSEVQLKRGVVTKKDEYSGYGLVENVYGEQYWFDLDNNITVKPWDYVYFFMDNNEATLIPVNSLLNEFASDVTKEDIL